VYGRALAIVAGGTAAPKRAQADTTRRTSSSVRGRATASARLPANSRSKTGLNQAKSRPSRSTRASSVIQSTPVLAVMTCSISALSNS
jgi:hypothetical protein